MKRRYVIGWLALFFCCAWNVWESVAQTVSKAGVRLPQVAQSAFPRTEIQVGDSLLQIGLETRNAPLLIEGMWKKQQGLLAISPDSVLPVIEQIDSLVKRCEEPVAQSMLYLMQAKIYTAQATSQLRYAFDETTQNNLLLGISNEELLKKTVTLLWKALEPARQLQQTDVLLYKAVLTEGAASRQLRPTMYDFVAHQVIDLLQSLQDYMALYVDQTPVKESYLLCPVQDFLQVTFDDSPYQVVPGIFRIYQDLLRFRETEPLSSPFLIDDLERVEVAVRYMNDFYYSEELNSRYVDFLFGMLDTYGDNGYSAEIVRKIYARVESSDRYEWVNRLYEWCRAASARFGDENEQTKVFDEVCQALTTPRLLLDTNLKGVFYPNEKQTLKYRYANIKDLHILVSRIETSAETYYQAEWDKLDSFPTKKVYEKSIHLNDTLTMVSRPLELTFPGLECGLYSIELLPDTVQSQKRKYVVSVSALLAQTLKYSDTDAQIIVTDGRSGKPRSGVAVTLYARKYPMQPTRTLYTDQDGIVNVSQQDSVGAYFIHEKKDDAYPRMNVPFFYPRSSGSYPYWVELDTDRGVYRPGQTVQFFGVAFLPEMKASGQKAQVVTNTRVEVSLTKNSKPIETQEFVTDEFGTFYGEFVLPPDADGRYEIRTPYNGIADFQVAQYKRPTFQITVDPVKSAYSFGVPVTLTGKVTTYSGVSLSGAKVNYRIVRAYNYFKTSYMWRDKQVEQGELTTDDEGNFSLRFIPEKEAGTKDPSLAERYQITFTVTSQAGETQQELTTLLVGESPLMLNIYTESYEKTFKERIFQTFSPNVGKEDSIYVKFSAVNMMNEPQTVPCKVTLFSLKDDRDPSSRDPLDSLKVDKQLFERLVSSGDSILVSEWRNLPSGAYRLRIETEGAQKTMKEQSFVLYSLEDRRPPVETLFWLPKTDYVCNEGEKASVLFGSSEKEVYVLAELFDDDRLLSCRWIKIGKENFRYEFPYLREYGNSLTLSLTYARNGESYNRQVWIDRQMPNQQLSIKSVTFRDHLVPGTDEKWSFSLADGTGKPVMARFVAGMYDASLNEIYPNIWHMLFQKFENRKYIQFEFLHTSYRDLSNYGYMGVSFPPLRFDNFAYPQGMLVRGSRMVAFAKAKSEAQSANGVQDMAADAAPMSLNVVATVAEEAEVEAGMVEIDYRNNFNETAFFYPVLQSNESGDVSFTFRVPDSNTRWLFQAFAYTKDLQNGQIDREVVSSKPLMVAPNIPRFVRQGDDVSVSAVVQNHSDQPDSGELLFELFNPYNDSVLVSRRSSFSLDAQATEARDFTFTVSEEYPVLGIRIRAEGRTHSDGEQHLVAVLPSRSMVTQTLPFGLTGKGSKTVTMNALKNNRSETLENYRLTLEYTVNPTWYVVQALPSMLPAEANNALGLITSYYANTLSAGIGKKNPRIETAIKMWKAQRPESSEPALLKNESLKSILISETPWVLEATDMAQRMSRLENLFDENRIAREQQAALNKLQYLQTSSGAWSWFRGMPPSTAVTMQVLTYLSRLNTLGFVEYGEPVKNMQVKALSYLDKEILEPRKEPRTSFTPFDVDYLYVRSAYRDIPLAGETLSQHKAMMDSLLNCWPRLGLGAKAKAAVAAFRYGFVEEAQAMVESLRQYATTTPQMGMFWDTSRLSASNPEGAIRTHTLIAQAFAEVDPRASETEAMKRWLLMQKQTQDWGNTVATSDAVYTLLSIGDDWLAVDKETVSLLWGGKPVDAVADDPFSGYIQQSKEAADIVPADATVTVSSSATHPSWGALYWQYFENFDQVEGAGSGLTLSKQLLVERVVEGKTKWVPLNNQEIVPGDKVRVSLVLSADRDMEFVYLKNQRAACFEPTEQLSGYKYKNGVGYYQQNQDAVTQFYFDFLPKGSFEITYDLWVDRSGTYHNGISTVQCLYAPQYAGQAPGEVIVVK